jgi:predicted AlkP superfamily phosphohydrolase/phosphomutase
MSKLLVIGLDAATFDVIEPAAAEGKLPNLARLIKNGASGPLRSTPESRRDRRLLVL